MFNYKLIGIQSFWLTILFMMIPTGVTLVTQVYAKSRFLYTATAASMFVVYVVLQTKVMVESDVKTQILNQKSISDSLTGLKNRRGYQQVIDSLKDEERVAVVFCDANGLKAINDSAGHQAGDDFIKKIAGLLTTSFSDEEICRISGDEFVVILRKSDYMRASILLNNFNNQIDEVVNNMNLKKSERISAAIGYSTYSKDNDKSVDDVFKRAASYSLNICSIY